jgi:hypothetical protein
MASRTSATCGAPAASCRAGAASRASLLALLAALASCAQPELAQRAAPAPPLPPPDAALVARVEALDPLHISAADVHDVLARAPAPRIILLQGSLAFVTMAPFGEFLIEMGYPPARIRNPRDGSLSYSSFADSATLAGMLAWYYEHDGMMPMLIGHSQGGMLVVQTLQELAGDFGSELHVVDPLTGEPQARTTIVDRLTGATRPVIGLKVPYAAAIATGRLPRLLLGQWTMLTRLRDVPNTVDEFTGYRIPFDPIAGEFGGSDPYVARGTAYSHIGLPDARRLAEQPATRAWIDAYVPGAAPAALPQDVDTTNLVHAADIWYSVRKHWCLEAQRLLRARSGRGGAAQ